MLPNTLLHTNTRAPSAGFSARLHFPGNALARFLELRGRRIVKDCGATWYSGGGHFLVSLPHEAILNPDPKELRRMLRETGAFGVRFPSASWSGVASGLYVMRPRDYDIESVDAEQRPQVLRAMESFRVRPATKAQMMGQGLALNRSSMARHGRFDPEFGERRRWETLVEAAFACSEISFPAAFCGSRLAAYMVTCREQRWLHVLHQFAGQEDLANSPDHLLTYTVTKDAVADEGLDAICYGEVPMCTGHNLHQYKLGFGYEVVPHRSAIQLHPVLDGVLNSGVARGAVRLARTLCGGHPQLERIECALEGARRSCPPEMVDATP